MDPEPLIALWPLRIPYGGTDLGLVTTVASPGVPLGSALKRHGAKPKRRPPGPAKNASDVKDAKDDAGAPAEPAAGPAESEGDSTAAPD
jgi:hypothetical protein